MKVQIPMGDVVKLVQEKACDKAREEGLNPWYVEFSASYRDCLELEVVPLPSKPKKEIVAVRVCIYGNEVEYVALVKGQEDHTSCTFDEAMEAFQDPDVVVEVAIGDKPGATPQRVAEWLGLPCGLRGEYGWPVNLHPENDASKNVIDR